MTAAASPGLRDLRSTAGALLLVLAWDATGADLAVARWFGDVHGFGARDSGWAGLLLHQGGRGLAWAMLLFLVLGAVRAPARPHRAPGRRQRLWWLGVLLTCLVVVPAAKRVSTTSCPWDLAEFGGSARHVSHWHWGLADGGAGHCFPSGHAVAAFAFFAMFFMWRHHRPDRARGWLFAVGATGMLFGFGQLARGAHFPSHTLWSAWACWSLCAAAAAVERRSAPTGGASRRPLATAARGPPVR